MAILVSIQREQLFWKNQIALLREKRKRIMQSNDRGEKRYTPGEKNDTIASSNTMKERGRIDWKC